MHRTVRAAVLVSVVSLGAAASARAAIARAFVSVNGNDANPWNMGNLGLIPSERSAERHH